MKAMAINPAVINAIDVPWNATGTSATLIRSRMAENKISTKENPIDAPKPYRNDSIKLLPSLTFSNATPKTAQFVVISGKNIPNT